MVKLTFEQALLKAKSHAKGGEPEKARTLLQAILKAFPNNKRARAELEKLEVPQQNISKNTHPPQEKLDSLISLYDQQKFNEAAYQAEKLTIDFPNSFVLWNILGASNNLSGKLENAVRAFKRAVELNPNFPEAYNNLGAILKNQGKIDEAIKAYQRALDINSQYAEAHNNLGILLKDQGKLDEATLAFQHALSIRPNYVTARYNIANVLKEQGQLDAAIAAYQLALEDNPGLVEVLNNLGNALFEKGKFEEAEIAFQRALKLNHKYGESHNNLGNTLKIQGKLKEAVSAYRNAVRLKPKYAEFHNNLGLALRDQGKSNEAISAYNRAVEIKPDYAEAHNNLGSVLKDRGEFEAAIAEHQCALKINPNYEFAQASLLILKKNICDFSITDELPEASSRLGIKTEPIPNFSALSWEDNAERQLLRAKVTASLRFKQEALQLPSVRKKRSDRLKVGYFSGDFHDHPAMFLLSGLFREHNKRQYETFAFSYGRNKSGIWRERARRNFDHFFDVEGSSDRSVVDLARSHQIDIAIDLQGYTRNTRSELFAYRLAPIQINYLGYPGSMGADFMDYIVADPIIIPHKQRQFYSENIIYLPHTYMPNDDFREIASTGTTRIDFGLPKEAFIFCCFNNSYKISPSEFDIWMRLLSKVDYSVLWLMKSNKWVEDNLRKEAEKRSVDPSRLIFAEKIPLSEHLARHKHADLFIDTFNYNAHTTASDALWSGLPLVTKQGNQFAARVAASVLTAVGLPELITETDEDYENLILKLATQPKQLTNIKAKLTENRLKKPLFDTKRYTRNFERGLQEAYDLYFSNKQPKDIWVSE